MKVNFDLDDILKMIDDGYMLKDVCAHYGCTRGKLRWFLKKYNLNFSNNKNARRNQRKLMSGEMNPTKGRKRTASEMRGISESSKLKAELYWDHKFKDGITFQQYAKVCRSIIPKEFKDKAKWQEQEVDHVFSIKDCWKNKIYPRYTSNPNNLRIVSTEENKSKSSKSEISLDEFLSAVGVQRLSKAQFNWKRVE